MLFTSETSQRPELCSEIDTVSESPAVTVSGTCTDGRGSVSTQAVYSTRPNPSLTSWVPAGIRSRLSTPPMPTQVALLVGLPVTTGLATVHVAVTPVKTPLVAA